MNTTHAIIQFLLLEAEHDDFDMKDLFNDPPKVDDGRFHSKKEVNVGTKIVYRGTGYSDDYYDFTRSDCYKVASFWRVPPGGRITDWSVKKVPKERSTHVSIHGVGGFTLPWRKFFRTCFRRDWFYDENNQPIKRPGQTL